MARAEPLAITTFDMFRHFDMDFFYFFFRPIYIGRAQIQMSVGASKSGLFLKTGGRRGSGASEL